MKKPEEPVVFGTEDLLTSLCNSVTRVLSLTTQTPIHYSGMVQRISIADGKAIHTGRYVDTHKRRLEMAAGKFLAPGFGTVGGGAIGAWEGGALGGAAGATFGYGVGSWLCN